LLRLCGPAFQSDLLASNSGSCGVCGVFRIYFVTMGT
jgi:hypothetical protein